MQVSNSKLKTWRRCPNQYRYKYVLKLKPKKRKLQLERGTWIHRLLQVHANGEDWHEEHNKLTTQFNNLWEEEREDLGDLPSECKRIMLAYLRTYKSDAQRYRVVDTELDEVVTLPNGLRLNVIIDKVLEDLVEGGLWVVDYKTRANFVDYEIMMLDPQLTLYYWSLEHMGYTPLRGTMYDEIRTKPPCIPAQLKAGGLTQRKNIDTDVYTYMKEVRRLGLDPSNYTSILSHIALNQKNRFFKRTWIPQDPPVIRQTMKEAVQTAQEIIEATRRNRFPRSQDMSCLRQCDYKNLCIAELYGGNIETQIKTNFERKT